MDAGRDLDALIAEKVMGWTRRVSADHTQSPVKVLRDVGIIYAWRDPRKRDMGLDLPPWSTDIGAAWQVVERMGKAMWCQMRTPFEGANSDGYWAGFTPHSTTGWNGTPDHWTQADTMPLAICLAALAAMEGD